MNTADIWSYNGWMGSSRKIRLEPGVWDENTRDVFCRGHCHSLAFALLELLPDAELYGAYEDGSLDHVFVRLADGRYLDGNGIVTEDEIVHGWGHDSWTDHLEDYEIEHEEERGNYRPRRTEDAMSFAQALIEREGVEVTDRILIAA